MDVIGCESVSSDRKKNIPNIDFEPKINAVFFDQKLGFKESNREKINLQAYSQLASRFSGLGVPRDLVIQQLVEKRVVRKRH